MFQRHDAGLDGGGGGARAIALGVGTAIPARRTGPTFAERFHEWRDRLDLVPDLGARIGSREWWQGAATCLGLCALAFSFAPGIRPVSTFSEPRLGEAQWEEARALNFAPLALGGDTGRRMAATDAVEPLTDTPERPRIELAATLGRGDGFARVLERSGVAAAEARTVASLVGDAVPLGSLKSGTRLDLVLGRRASRSQPRPLDELQFRAAFDLSLRVVRENGALKLVRMPIAVDATPLRITGRIGSSLYKSARAAGAPANAVEAYIRAIGSRLSLSRDVRAGDRFDIIVAHRRAATGETEVGDLLYAGLDRGAKKETRLLRWTVDGREQWFEASGAGETRGAMRRPVAGAISSSFGMRRHPILGFSRLHKGMDFAAPHGAPILAATDGRVSFAGRNRGYGNYVRLDHGNGIATSYAHMSRIAARVGTRVKQGQVIGYVGSTGLSTGPHLHYELYRNGVAVNPNTVKFTTTTRLAGAELARFKSRLNQLMGLRVAAPAQTQTAAAKDPAKKA